MREAKVIVHCDRSACGAKWEAEPGDEPVVLTLPDGTRLEADLCAIDQQELVDTFFEQQREPYEPRTRSAKKGSPRKIPKEKAELPKKAPRKFRSRACPIAGCSSRPSSPGSMRAHIRNVHMLTSEEAAAHTSSLFKTRMSTRHPCPECGDTFSNQSMPRHRLAKHGVRS